VVEIHIPAMKEYPYVGTSSPRDPDIPMPPGAAHRDIVVTYIFKI
jgi:hypothetical protein